MAETKTPSKRGGRRPGAGRKPLSGEALSESIVVRVTPAERKLFLDNGGAPWLRRLLGAVRDQLRIVEDRQLGFEHLRAVHDGQDDRRIRSMIAEVACGFPSPALDYSSEDINLNDYLVPHPEATILVQASGESMNQAGIRPGDLLVVDRSLLPRDGDVAVVMVNNDCTAKRLRIRDGRIELHPESDDPRFEPIIPSGEDEVVYVGVVTSVIRRMRRG